MTKADGHLAVWNIHPCELICSFVSICSLELSGPQPNFISHLPKPRHSLRPAACSASCPGTSGMRAGTRESQTLSFHQIPWLKMVFVSLLYTHKMRHTFRFMEMHMCTPRLESPVHKLQCLTNTL